MLSWWTLLAGCLSTGACQEDQADHGDSGGGEGEGEGESDAGGEGEGEGEGVGEWQPMSMEGAPQSRLWHSAVWTGRELLIWGGESGGVESTRLATGGRYDPAADRWTSVAELDAPLARAAHVSVWTGQELLVFGGLFSLGEDEELLVDGGRYDPEQDTWQPIGPSGESPPPSAYATAVWTGQEMIVWGGVTEGDEYLIGGSAYDPDTDAWRRLATDNAPEGRDHHVAVWTGTEMIVWGGMRGSAPDRTPVSSGGRYDPALDGWLPMSTQGAPDGRASSAVVWTGIEMIVWGSTLEGIVGHRYDPAADRWSPVSPEGPPQVASQFSATWIGERVALWGGDSVVPSESRSGGLYDPTTESWDVMSSRDAPAGRFEHTATWTGGMLLIWGGQARDVEDPRDLGGARFLP